MGGVIKLVGYGCRKGERVYAAVAPSIVSKKIPMYSVNGVFNAICAKGNAVGEVMFYGRGAGKLPTASAVVADICDIAKDPGNKNYFWSDAPEDIIIPYSEATESYLVRVKAKDADKLIGSLGGGEKITAAEGETGVISPYMSNDEFCKRTEGFDIIKKIRIHKGE